MTPIIINVEKGVKPPTSNNFDVYAYNLLYMGPFIFVDTGIDLQLTNRMTLNIIPEEDFVVVSWTLSGITKREDIDELECPKNRLALIMLNRKPIKKIGATEEPDKLATVLIVKNEIEKVRFMQKAEGGGRVIRGEGKIANSVETGSVEPGEQIPNTDAE